MRFAKRLAHTGYEDGANEWTRTTDLLFTKQLLCRLSYVGTARWLTILFYYECSRVSNRILPGVLHAAGFLIATFCAARANAV